MAKKLIYKGITKSWQAPHAAKVITQTPKNTKQLKDKFVGGAY